MTDEQLIQKAIEHIDQQGHVDTNYIIAEFCEDKKRDWNKALGIGGKMQQTGEFILIPLREYDVIYMLRNPNYTLNENIIATNTSTQTLNKSLKSTNCFMVLIAAITGLFVGFQLLFSILDFKKKESQEPQLIRQQLEQTTQILDKMMQSLKEIDSSLQTKADSTLSLKKTPLPRQK